MPSNSVPVKSTQRTTFTVLDKLDGGWSTRSYPHQIKDSNLALLDNFVRIKDSIWTIRPGNIPYGGGGGGSGSGVPSLAGCRFYRGTPVSGQLCVQSGGNFYTGLDGTGAFSSQNAGMSTTQPATFAQMYDPDNQAGAATTLFICDGSRPPQRWDGTNFGQVNTAATYLPTGLISGQPIKPLYCTDWNYNFVYANEPTDPCAVWISDPLRPESFTATAFTDSAGNGYFPYYPGGRNASLGVITGVLGWGQYLLVFFTSGVVVGYNTGSYGTFQYVWTVLSRTIGCPAPRSIVAMDAQVLFFGGDRFYATDGQTLAPVPDEIPSIYSHNNVAQGPPEMTNVATVAAFRRGLSYMVSYQSNQGSLYNDRMLVFDTQAQGGWYWQGFLGSAPSGGAWSRFPSGMPLNWGVECRGPGDSSYPCFWGLSNQDLVSQHDPSAQCFTDFGNPIPFEIRTKSFFFDKPVNEKVVEGIYPILVFAPLASPYGVNISPYAVFDGGIKYAFSQVFYSITQVTGGTTYGGASGPPLYDTGLVYGGGQPLVAIQQTQKSYSFGGGAGGALPRGFSMAAGLTGNSSNSFNLIGFVVETITDEVEF